MYSTEDLLNRYSNTLARSVFSTIPWCLLIIIGYTWLTLEWALCIAFVFYIFKSERTRYQQLKNQDEFRVNFASLFNSLNDLTPRVEQLNKEIEELEAELEELR